MRIKSLILIALCCLVGLRVEAQKSVLKEFSQEELPEQMLQHLNNATSEKEKQKANQQLVQAFERVYADMDAPTKGRVTGISNVLLKLRVKQLPDVYNFLSTLTAFYNVNQKDQNFEQWLSSIEYIQARNKKVKDFTDFVEFTQGLLQDRTLCRTRGAQWQAQAGATFRLHLEGSEIIVSFDRPMELYYASDKDNGTIYGTQGDYYYFDSKWVGRGGRLNWDRTGLPSTQCWAVLNRYEAVAKFAKFVADSALFTNTKYFTEPVLGRVEEQLSAPMEAEKYSFPKFRSYQKDFSLKDILPGVDYEGTFMMNGSKFVTSDTKNPSTLVFYRDGARFLTVQSPKFTITASRIVSENAAVKMYLGQEDSITNNGILVRYSVPDKQVVLVNDSKRNYYSPYSNSYHQLDMYCENMVWKMDKNILDFSMLTGTSGSQNFSTFESTHYYSERKYREIQMQDEVSPVVRVYNYVKARDWTYDFFIDEFAKAIHMDIMQAKAMVHVLARHGLVSYDEASAHVYVKDKLVDYMHAYAKDKKSGFDYDALVFESNAKGSNAVLDLSSNDIAMHGVEKFVLSDSQQVVIYPKGGDMVMHRGRDIEFSGRVHAGRFVSYVTDAYFHYDDFRIDLPQVDSMYFYVTNFVDPNKDHIVYTPLYNLVGNIQIDSSNNHSGLKDSKDYPIFTSTQDCYVFYDRKDIFNGTYTRDRFFYTVNPFKVKDMVDFRTDELEFNGYLTSGGIFPVIKEPLKVQRDYSLGFEIETPRSGLPAYGGKGQFKESIDLSYTHGLRGQGSLTYLSATIQSKSMLFTPDSMQAVSDTFFVKEDNIFPQIANSRCAQHWFPYQDSMRVVQLQKGPQFKMFRGDALLSGDVCLRPSGANARGAVTIGEGTITSNHFTLQPRLMDAQVSHFLLRSDIYKSVAFEAHDMRSHTDFEKRFAEFTANKPIERTTLPLLQYAAYVDKFRWEIDQRELQLLDSKSESTAGLEGLALRERIDREQPGARFVSTDPKRDSLQFHSVRAAYLYNEGQLSCRDVFALHCGDAAIAPGGDTLHIRQGGQIDLLKNSQLLASRNNRNHLIYKADLIVEGARKFSGKGYIDYEDENGKKQPIFLSELAPDASGMTVGRGFIADSAHFTLNDAFGFAGSVRVESDSANYYFEGGVRLLHQCAPEENLGLLAYKAYTDPRMVLVEVPELPTDWKGNRITASILFDKSLLEPRNAFLTNERAADNELMTAHGLLHYDNLSGRYTISSREKIEDPENVVAQYLSLDTKSCLVSGEGPINFNQRSNFVDLFCYGMAELDTKQMENTTFNSLLGFSFPIDEKVLTTMQQLLSDDLRLSPSSPDNEVVRHAMMYYMGAEQGAENYAAYVSSGFYEKMPHEFESTILLEGIRWQYDPAKGYYFNGMAGLASIGKKQMHLNTRVKAQLQKRGTGVYLTLYIQAAMDHWYYFNYEFNSQTLNIYSSSGEWLDMIKAIPADKRTLEGKSGQGSYRYRVGSSRTEVPNFHLRLDGGKASDAQDDEEEDD